MFYSIVRPIVAIALKIYFTKIYFTNRDRIPMDKPLIMAINHPSAFIEPCVCACYQARRLYFLVRGNLFKKPIFKAMLNALHMVPIFRASEGFGNLGKNTDTFRFCYEALNEKKTIVILPEGKTIQEKRLRPIKKGLARIAFGTYEEYGDIDLEIICVGVNFSQANKFRSFAMFDVSEPIKLSDYFESYKENPRKAMAELTADVKNTLEERIVNILNKEDEPLAESLFTIYRNNHPDSIFPILSNNEAPVQAERKIANTVTHLPQAEKENWNTIVGKYFEKIKSLGVEDKGIVNIGFDNLKNTLLLIFGFIPFLIGWVGNYLPLRIGKYFYDNKVKQLEFKAPVALGVAIGFYLIYFFGFMIFAYKMMGWLGIAIVLLVFFLGRFALIYQDHYQMWSAARRVGQLDADELQNLKKQRAAIVDLVKCV